MYLSKPVDGDQIVEIKKQKGWDHICENHHGSCYYNSVTGELIWEADEDEDSNASLLQTTWDKLVTEWAAAAAAMTAKAAPTKPKSKKK